MCVECGCATPVPFGVKVLRAFAPGLLKPAPVPVAVMPPAVTGATRAVDLHLPLLDKNNAQAQRNRAWFTARRVLALNLVSSPGAGKTTLLARTVDDLGRETPCATLVGDLETDHDAQRLARPYAPAVQITTGTACHLDAAMVERGLQELGEHRARIIFIENVGNLVCPAEFDLGEAVRVVLLSATEGEEKPLKYPPIFKTADLVLLTKVDVAAALGFDRHLAAENVRRIAPQARLIEVSARSGEGLEAWYGFLRERLVRG
jgi:hydrogenase nickel incorporation protein HypB